MSKPIVSGRAALLGFFIGGAFLVAFLQGQDWGEIQASLAAASPAWFAAALGVQFFLYTVKVWRWALLFPPPAPSVRHRWEAIGFGFGANAILPGRAGEAIRAAAMYKSTGIPLSHVVSSLVLERLMDLAALGFALGAGAVALGVNEGSLAVLRSVGLVTAAGTLAAPLVLYALLGRNEERARSWIEAVVRFAPEGWRAKLTDFALGVSRGLSVLGSLPRLLQVFALSLLHWSFAVVGLLLTAKALGVQLSPAGASVVLGAVAFASALPQAPGFIGPFHWAISETLELLGQSDHQAAAFAILAWLCGIVPALVLGGLATLSAGRGQAEALFDEPVDEEAGEAAASSPPPGDRSSA